MTSMFIIYSVNKQVFIEDLYQAMNYSQHVRGVIEQNRLKPLTFAASILVFSHAEPVGSSLLSYLTAAVSFQQI